MPTTIALSLRLFCIATALLLAAALAAESSPSPSLLGSTREQVVRRMGEPRSQIVAGNRLMMFYARERVVLRDGVVVDVDQVVAEPVRRQPAPTQAPAPTAAAGQTQPGAEPSAAAVPASSSSVPAVPAPAAPVSAAAPAASPAAGSVQPPPSEPAAAPKAEAAPPPSPEPKLEIKLVRPPSPGSPRSQPLAPRPAPATTAAVTPVPAPPAAKPPAAKLPVAPASVQAVPPPADEIMATKVAATLPAQTPLTAVSAPPSAPLPSQPAATPNVRAEPSTQTVKETTAAEQRETSEREKAAAAAAEKKAKVIKESRRRLEATLDSVADSPEPSGFSLRTYVIAFVAVFGGIGYMVWRRRQRRLELEASAVSQDPFSASVGTGESATAKFTASLLEKLEWKRFEELTEAYYCKTGVVAVRTKSGPFSPAQIKISWKGESRPFAMVRCLASPVGLIEVELLQELYTLLAAEDIRRGYVVTTGKFTDAARDYAEEKQLTLLSGDIFLEKLNALPAAARSEIMQAVAEGDYSTPSCPTCEAKMSRSDDVPPVWRCASHPTSSLPVRD